MEHNNLSSEIYVVTGAGGHLGNALIRQLSQKGKRVCGLLYGTEHGVSLPGVSYLHGDVCDLASLHSLFAGCAGSAIILIHAAGIVDITGKMFPALYNTNVGGIRNVLDLCMQYNVKRLVYVSSVHAIPERTGVQTEISQFSPDAVIGGYAKTKAEASQMVLDATTKGLDAVIVHPSGILGPYDDGRNHLVQMIQDCVEGRIPASVNGGYDFVDVRDVAEGCIQAAENGQKGECYILSGHYCKIPELFRMICATAEIKKRPVIPMWLARAGVPFIEYHSSRRCVRSLYTGYSLHTLRSNGQYSNKKARVELGYTARPLEQSILDTIVWLQAHVI